MSHLHTILASQNSPWNFVPRPVVVGSRYHFVRSEFEAFKKRLAGLPPDDSPSGVVEFVSFAQAATEISCHSKTLKKWARLALQREAGKPTPEPQRQSAVIGRNRPSPKRLTRSLETV